MKIIEPSVKQNELPKAGDVYRHFKGTNYVVIGHVVNATNGADTSPMILYVRKDQLGKNHYDYFCRDAKEFISRVDKKKYPNATQDLRFERIQDEKGERQNENH